MSLASVQPGSAFKATCAGWSTPDTVHRRIVALEPDALRIEDRLEGRPRPARLVLPLAPGLEPELTGARARVPLPSGPALAIELPENAQWRVERAPYYPEFGCERERAVLVGEALDPASLRWALRRDLNER